MARKSDRHSTLLKLIDSTKIHSQTALMNAMRKKGYPVTQPSISRDLKELNIVKMNGHYCATASITTVQKQYFSVLVLIRSITCVGPHLMVIKTEQGAANVVAALVDTLAEAGIVGSVAGDDTLFVATRHKSAQANLRRLITNHSENHQ